MRKKKPDVELPEDNSHLHKIAAAGCYTIGLTLAFSALIAMWGYVFNPSLFLGKIIIASITGIGAMVFLWLLLIKKW